MSNEDRDFEDLSPMEAAQAMLEAVGQEVRKRSGLGDEEWKDVVKETQDEGGTVVDLMQKALGGRKTSARRQIDSNEAEKMTRKELSDAYGRGDVSTETFRKAVRDKNPDDPILK